MGAGVTSLLAGVPALVIYMLMAMAWAMPGKPLLSGVSTGIVGLGGLCLMVVIGRSIQMEDTVRSLKTRLYMATGRPPV